ncbi:MAG: hypothetical protein U5K36_01530 [Roseovarius sp.]|nr:hypothetical protein [Roseovarius sp.]
MAFARDCGYARMQLWTHESHRAACALYAAHGWRLTASRSRCAGSASTWSSKAGKSTFRVDRG